MTTENNPLTTAAEEVRTVAAWSEEPGDRSTARKLEAVAEKLEQAASSTPAASAPDPRLVEFLAQMRADTEAAGERAAQLRVATREAEAAGARLATQLEDTEPSLLRSLASGVAWAVGMGVASWALGELVAYLKEQRTVTVYPEPSTASPYTAHGPATP